jgi:hypothetical protein
MRERQPQRVQLAPWTRLAAFRLRRLPMRARRLALQSIVESAGIKRGAPRRAGAVPVSSR